MGHEGHEHGHMHEHESAHEHSPSHEAAANQREELAALMRYMVGHNASHIDELANLAEQLNTIGEAGAYDRIQHAIELFRHGNEHLEEVLDEMHCD